MKEVETWVEQRGEEDEDDGEEGEDGEEDSDSEGVETLAEAVHDDHSHQPNLEDPPYDPYHNPIYLNHGYANYDEQNYGYWDYHQQQWFPYNPYL